MGAGTSHFCDPVPYVLLWNLEIKVSPTCCVFLGLLSSFVEVESIKRHFKSRLVGTVLNGYLCLRKLVVQRTKLIDETQDMLLEMLEDMTTGKTTSVP